jgi:asparagine synthase (glutamine-hydrolysing)
MSGISGIYNLDGHPANPFALKQMSDALAHRGPDGTRQWIHGPVGFTHLRNNTTPESVYERQPLGNEDGSCWLTMDGRIDNGPEVRTTLESKGLQCRDATDAELVLRAYECWCEDCPKRLLGDFAFAIWDSRKQHLFCARDHLGVRPFYYHRGASQFAFGSEIRALLALETIPRRLNESRLVDFLV